MKKEVSLQMQRLYQAAKLLRNTEGKTNVASLLRVSPQALNNWESGRQLSDNLLLTAQEIIGCDAIWLRDGTGEMIKDRSSNGINPSELAQLIALYLGTNSDGRAAILENAAATVKNALIGKR